jgi:hypothetical protein
MICVPVAAAGGNVPEEFVVTERNNRTTLGKKPSERRDADRHVTAAGVELSVDVNNVHGVGQRQIETDV